MVVISTHHVFKKEETNSAKLRLKSNSYMPPTPHKKFIFFYFFLFKKKETVACLLLRLDGVPLTLPEGKLLVSKAFALKQML